MQRIVSAFFFVLWITAPTWAELPYRAHGWEPEEAAAHLLSRFTYGARPGEVERVVELGLERWLEGQLAASLPDPVLEEKLATLPEAYRLSPLELAELYPSAATIRKMAQAQGISKESEGKREAVQAMLEANGKHLPRELDQILFAQRLMHARHSENGLREVLTDFWFNHFNVAVSNNQARPHLLTYERDVIRPLALSHFRTLLGATAKHPAMLLYLDNAQSTAGKDAPTLVSAGRKPNKLKRGLNENYARELMELHTLGVDGGYQQQDVVEVARAFTGWTTPFLRQRSSAPPLSEFVFAAALHDSGPKTILGQPYPARAGVEEGERVLDLLSFHPSTANHLARKLAVRFISDTPDPNDLQRISQSFHNSGGDLRAVVRTIAHSDGFWDKKNRFCKVKTPLELVVSANRALQGDLYPTRQLYGWMAKMGQPIYNYQAPTGFPDKADYWVSSATVLNRVNFGLHAARGMVPGFTYRPKDWTLSEALNQLLPQGDTLKARPKLENMLADAQNLVLEPVKEFETRPNLGGFGQGNPGTRMKLQPNQQNPATMIGLILGTPEFQRR